MKSGACAAKKEPEKGVIDRENECAVWDSEAGKSAIAAAKRMAAHEQMNAGGEKTRKVFSSRKNGIGKPVIGDIPEGPGAFNEDERRAAWTVFSSSLGSIKFLASSYAGKRRSSGWAQTDVDADDLRQEGHLGQIKALTRFKPEMGNRFYTYSLHWVLNYMRDAFKRAIRASKDRINLYQRQDDDADEQVDPFSRIPDNNERNAEDRYANEESKVNAKKAAEVLLGALTPFECIIIKKRLGFDEDPLTLQQIGDQYNLSRERIRQLEEGALRKMRIKALDLGIEDAA